jgi:hypothetical protein
MLDGAQSIEICELPAVSANVVNDVPRFRRLKNCCNCHKIEGFPGNSMVEHSAVNRCRAKNQ